MVFISLAAFPTAPTFRGKMACWALGMSASSPAAKESLSVFAGVL